MLRIYPVNSKDTRIIRFYNIKPEQERKEFVNETNEKETATANTKKGYEQEAGVRFAPSRKRRRGWEGSETSVKNVRGKGRKEGRKNIV